MFVFDQYGCVQQGLTPEQFAERSQEVFGSALRRAKIGDHREDNIHATSLDSTARDPLRVPWANYPLHPVVCARLIGDRSTRTTTMIRTRVQTLNRPFRSQEHTQLQLCVPSVLNSGESFRLIEAKNGGGVTPLLG